MNVGVVRESWRGDRRVALTPPAVRRLVDAGHVVWVETGAGSGALYRDQDYIAAGAEIAWSNADVLQRSDVVAKISTPSAAELELCRPEAVVMAFYHMAVADRSVLDALLARRLTSVGCEIIETDDGRLPVLAPISAIAGQMTVTLAAHLLRSSSGGRGILLGGSPGVAPAHLAILGAGAVGTAAARAAAAAGARLTVLDVDAAKLERLAECVAAADFALADAESIGAAAASADVLIGAVLVAGSRTPHVVTRGMVEGMQPGTAVIDVSIDQGGCVETSRPTTLSEPTFVYRGVTHFCVPNFTSDLGRSASVAVAHSMLPYLLAIGQYGISEAMLRCTDLARGAYTHLGSIVSRKLAEAWHA